MLCIHFLSTFGEYSRNQVQIVSTLSWIQQPNDTSHMILNIGLTLYEVQAMGKADNRIKLFNRY